MQSGKVTATASRDDAQIKPQSGEFQVRGRAVRVPSTAVRDRTIVVTGTWLKMAAVQDEEVVEGDVVDVPDLFIANLQSNVLRPDIFTFRQRLTDPTPRLNYTFEPANLAVIPVRSYEHWWQSLSQETRRNVRRAAKHGVEIRTVEFDEALVRGIKAIYDETPMRQGRKFWHYGKDLQTVKKENGTYLKRSEFIGAYYGDELIGYMKIIYVDDVATIIQILSKIEHSDKRPTNGLIAKAVEICEQKRKAQLVYCKYTYGNDEASPLAEFKRRNGFEKLVVPRYYVPLTTKGKLAMKLKLHLGLREVLPQGMLMFLLNLRSTYQGLRIGRRVERRPASA
jgi:hypothetical protein